MTEAQETSQDAAAKEVSREEAQELIDEEAQLVDVRAPHEWGAGRIPGARHLPLEQLSELVDELDRSRPVIAYCRGGTRSTMATEALAGAGFDAAKLSEGIVGCDEAGLELAPEDGYVAESGEAASILQARKRAS